MDEQGNSNVPGGGGVATESQPQREQTEQQQYENALYVLDRQVKSGGNWFYWIAGLSLINTAVALFNGSMAFVVGLGFTQIVDAIIKEYGGLATVIGLPINLMVAAAYAMFGYFACRRARWAFITGIVFYSLDTLLVLSAKDIMMLGFHVFALYCISKGLKADTLARQVQAQQKQVASQV